MARYLIIWEHNNGYSCGCCRQTWSSYEETEFDSEEDAQNFIESNKNRDYCDTQLEAVYPISGDALYE